MQSIAGNGVFTMALFGLYVLFAEDVVLIWECEVFLFFSPWNITLVKWLF